MSRYYDFWIENTDQVVEEDGTSAVSTDASSHLAGSSDFIQFVADSDEQQNDTAAAGSTSVCIVAAIRKEKLLILTVTKYYHSVAEKTVTVMHCCSMLRCRNQREMNQVKNSQQNHTVCVSRLIRLCFLWSLNLALSGSTLVMMFLFIHLF